MVKDISITDIQRELETLPERLAEEPGAVAVTQQGKPVLAILPWDFYESIVETLEIMSDETLMNAFRKGVKEAEDHKTMLWEEARKGLDV